jgi:2Fe-2S ferredoxin
MQIHVTDHQGQTHSIEATQGWRVMEIMKEAGLPVRADCGGCCACATCHVYVAPEWLPKLKPANGEETNLLGDSFVLRDHSRLSCQLIMTKELDGLTLTLSDDTV